MRKSVQLDKEAMTTQTSDERYELYAEVYDEIPMSFVHSKALEALIRIEQQDVIDEVAYFKALEILSIKDW